MKPFKNPLSGLFIIAGILALAGFIQAQVASTPAQSGTVTYTDWRSASDLQVLLAAIELTTPQAASDSPECGNFYTVQHAEDWPPLPANFYGLPFWDLGGGFYLLDDRNFDYEALAQEILALHTLAVAMGLESDSEEMGSSFPIDTNGLWLEITNVADGLAYLNLHNGTDYVYEVWSKRDLAATNWDIETEVFPGTNLDVMPFTVSQLDRRNLSIWARDWTDITSGGNTVPEWWFWKFYHTLDGLSDTNWDSTGANTLLYDYTNNLDPNIIGFSVAFTNQYVNSSPVSGAITILGGVPAYEAVLVNDTNFADAVWQPYDPNASIPLNSGDGSYGIQIGLRGFPPDAQQTWIGAHVTLDTVPPVVMVTNPVATIVSQPMIQLQGLVNEELSSLTFDVSNAAGIFTNQTGYTSEWYYDTNLLAFTTNLFQCYDVALTNGFNVITLHAADLAGNSTITNVSFTLDYSGDTTPPTVSLVWPQNGMVIAGTNFALQAQVDDATAKISASMNDDTNNYSGTIQRDGTVRIWNLPLTADTNTVTLIATDAVGNSSTNSITLARSAVTVTIDPISDDQLNQPSVMVTGTITDASDSVSINGVKASVNTENNTWIAYYVPVSPTGMASLDVEVSDSASNSIGSQIFNPAQPATVVLSSYDGKDYYWEIGQTEEGEYFLLNEGQEVDWNYIVGGAFKTWQRQDWYYDWPIPPSGPGFAAPWIADPGFSFTPPWEFSELNLSPYGDSGLERSLRTHVMIAPGGETNDGPNKLYLIRAAARELSAIYGDMGIGWPVWNGGADVPLPPEWLKIQGRTLVNTGQTNDDGAVWGKTVVYGPAGAPVDVTPVATQLYSYNDYVFDVQVEREVKLKIFAITNGTAIDLSTNIPEFCVGQKVTFFGVWDHNPGAVSTNYAWAFSSTFVNHSSQASSSASTNWDIDSSIFTTNEPYAYWVSGGNKNVFLHEILHFSNGQSATFSASGQFSMFRPSVAMVNPTNHGTAMNIWRTPWNMAFFGDIGLGNVGGPNNMSYLIRITSADFAGDAKITQICAISATALVNINVTNELDNTDPYTNATVHVNKNPNPQGTINELELDDAPSDGWFNSFRDDSSFIDFVMFAPNVPESIYVPLGKITWSTSFGASYPSTNISPNTVTGPIGPDSSQDWPIWTAVFSNSN